MVSVHHRSGETADAATSHAENDRLRASLDEATAENAELTVERDRFCRRVGELVQQIQLMRTAMDRQTRRELNDAASRRDGLTEDDLRGAFVELQMLTEQLEVANSSLHRTNHQLDARVEERTSQLNEIDAALRATQASLRTVADLVPELLWRADRHGAADWFNQRWVAVTGQPVEQAIDDGWLDCIHPDDAAATAAAWAAAIRRGTPYEHEHRIRDTRGDHRWFLVRAEPLRDERGMITRWFVAGTDIHDQRAAMEALGHSERRFRTLIDGIPQLVWSAVDGGRWTWSSPQWREYTGQSDESSRALGWIDAFHPEDRAHACEAWRWAQATGSLDIEGRILHAGEGRYRHFRTRAHAVRDDSGRIVEWLGTSTDVDDLLRLQEQQAMLVGELQHRTRNLMGVVRSVTARTVRGADTLDQFKTCIDDRLAALARVQGLLSRRAGGERVAFDALLHEELAAHGQIGGGTLAGKITLDGPRGIALRSATVQTFALALHELMTNAMKYGALARTEGRLAIAWHVRAAGDGDRILSVDWRESGVDDMRARSDDGHGGGWGRELIEHALPYQLGARTSYRMERDGVHCTIEVTVPSDERTVETSYG